MERSGTDRFKQPGGFLQVQKTLFFFFLGLGHFPHPSPNAFDLTEAISYLTLVPLFVSGIL